VDADGTVRLVPVEPDFSMKGRTATALRRLVDAGAKPRPAATAVAELTGGSANALYKALTQ